MIIVDDEPYTAENLSLLLDYNKYSFQVLGHFDCVYKALDFIKKNPVDLIVSDINMPDINGIELLKIINTDFPKTKVILFSAYRDFEYARMAVSHKAFEYLTKPISYTDYTNALIRACEELSNERNFSSSIDDTNKFVTKNLCDYFNNIISKETLLKQLHINDINYNILHSECALAELKINDFENYLSTTWLYGKDRLFNALKNIIQNSSFECWTFTLSSTDNSLKIIMVKNTSADFEKSKSDFYSYLKNELKSILCINVTIIEIHSCSSVIALKKLIPTSIDNYVSIIMADLINNEFEEISSIKQYCFSHFPIEDLYDLCEQLSIAVKQTINKMPHQHFLNPITIRSIKKPSILNAYFDEIIESCRENNISEPLAKDIILEAIKYVDRNYSKNITLSIISKHISLNASYFSDFFKKQTGECFSDFLLKIRIEHAKELLKNNANMKIQNICEYIGYKSMPYFYKAFQSYTGYSPTQYKKYIEETKY